MLAHKLRRTTSGPPVAVSFEDSGSDAADLTTYTFTSRSIGSAASDRIIYVAVWVRDTGTTTTINSVTIGGVSATKVGAGAKTTFGGNISLMEWWAVDAGSSSSLSAATTATVVVVLNQGVVRCAISVYRKVGGVNSLILANSYQSIGDDPSVSIDLPARGAALAAAAGSEANSGTITWTGLNEDIELMIESRAFGSAHVDFASAQSGMTVQATISTTESSAVLECIVLPASAGNILLTPEGSASSITDASSYNFSGVDIGTADPGRVLFILVQSQRVTGTAVAPTVTVGGVAATERAFVIGVTEPRCALTLFSIPYTADTTADIVVTHSAAHYRTAVSVFSVIGLKSAVPVDSDGGDLGAYSVDTAPGGIVLAAGARQSSTAGITWTNATEAQELAYGEGSWYFSSAYAENTTGSAVTVTGASDGGSSAQLVASFR